jgi:hypothetical protein
MKIALKKIKITDIEIIQSEVLKFIRYKIDNLAHCNDCQNYCIFYDDGEKVTLLW